MDMKEVLRFEQSHPINQRQHSTITKKQVFNAVARHLLEQGERSEVISREGTNNCLYRGPNGTKCAVGFLIKDEYYHPELEGTRVNAPAVIQALEYSGVLTNPDMLTMLNDLQCLHDRTPISSWDMALQVLEDRHIRNQYQDYLNPTFFKLQLYEMENA